MLRTQYYGKDIRDQNGQQVIASLIQFAVHKSMLKGVDCQIKAINLEVAFTMLSEKNTEQITCTYCATPKEG